MVIKMGFVVIKIEIYDTQSAQIPQWAKYIDVIMKTSCFCAIWVLCVSWITYDHLYYAPFFDCSALFGSLIPAIRNHTSCAQVHELPQSDCGDNWEGTLFSWKQIYITLILLLWDFSTLCVVDHLWPLTLCSLFNLLSTSWFIGKSNV